MSFVSGRHLLVCTLEVLLISSSCQIGYAYRSALFADSCSSNNDYQKALSLSPTTVRAEKLASLASQVHSGIALGKMLGKGGFGIAFDATLENTRRVVKFTATNNRNVRTWRDVEVATWENEAFRQRLKDMRYECWFMKGLVHSKRGKLAAKEDAAGASALSGCVLNCHRDNAKCQTQDAQPPFIVVEYAGMNGNKWLQSGPAVVEVCAVLNQVREGIRFMSEVRNPPVIHHDLKWDNVCVQPKEEAEEKKLLSKFILNFKANIIDFGAAIVFVYHGVRTYRRSVGSLGYAPPEWFQRIPYDDPPWSFDVYALGAMSLYALCGISQGALFNHGNEMKKLLVCSETDLCIKKDQCAESGDCCSYNQSTMKTCDVDRETFIAAKSDIDFSKAPKSYARLRSYDTLHSSFCNKAVTEDNLRNICQSMQFLLHPNPLWRLMPSRFKFDATRGIVEVKGKKTKKTKKQKRNI